MNSCHSTSSPRTLRRSRCIENGGPRASRLASPRRHTLQCRECLIDALDDLGGVNAQVMRQKGRKLLAGLSELDPRAFGVAPFQVNERRSQDHQPAAEVALCPVPNGNHLLVVGGRHVLPGREVTSISALVVSIM